jgi:hypothetical protein
MEDGGSSSKVKGRPKTKPRLQREASSATRTDESSAQLEEQSHYDEEFHQEVALTMKNVGIHGNSKHVFRFVWSSYDCIWFPAPIQQKILGI